MEWRSAKSWSKRCANVVASESIFILVESCRWSSCCCTESGIVGECVDEEARWVTRGRRGPDEVGGLVGALDLGGEVFGSS